MSTTPPWPSLYNPAVELFPIEHKAAVQSCGRYLHNPNDIFRFTLYWTFVLYIPSFIICGCYAFFNLSCPPSRGAAARKGYTRTRLRQRLASLSGGGGPWFRSQDGESIPLQRRRGRRHEPPPSPNLQQLHSNVRADVRRQSQSRTRGKQNETRSRLTFAVLVFMLFAVYALGGAVVGSAIIGYVLAGLFMAAKYNMSTWIPFLGAIMQTLLGFLALWPTVIDII